MYDARGQPFTTKDNDNDADFVSNCAHLYHGAWWYFACHLSNLNGDYGNDLFGQGLNWVALKGPAYSFPFAQMKIEKMITA